MTVKESCITKTAGEADAFGEIVGIIFRTVGLCTRKLGGFLARVQYNSGG